jgi:hypothetical protein
MVFVNALIPKRRIGWSFVRHLLNSFNDRGLVYRDNDEYITVALEYDAAQEQYTLPAGIPPGTWELRIEGVECVNDEGTATVVCNLEGTKMHGFAFPRARFNQAHFEKDKSLATVTANAGGAYVVTVYEVQVSQNRANFTQREYPMGTEPSWFKAATTAAIQKARCPGCTCVHFATNVQHPHSLTLRQLAITTVRSL